MNSSNLKCYLILVLANFGFLLINVLPQGAWHINSTIKHQVIFKRKDLKCQYNI